MMRRRRHSSVSLSGLWHDRVHSKVKCSRAVRDCSVGWGVLGNPSNWPRLYHAWSALCRRDDIAVALKRCQEGNLVNKGRRRFWLSRAVESRTPSGPNVPTSFPSRYPILRRGSVLACICAEIPWRFSGLFIIPLNVPLQCGTILSSHSPGCVGKPPSTLSSLLWTNPFLWLIR